MSAIAATGLDPFDVRLARADAGGRLRRFNEAGVLSAADVHVARRLAALAGERDGDVALAVALAVRAPRLGHVYVDLATIRGRILRLPRMDLASRRCALRDRRSPRGGN